MKQAYFNWSGGKDSSWALWKILQQKEYSVNKLLTSVNAVHDRVSMHGVRRSLLEDQAAALGIPLTTVELPEQPGMTEYEEAMLNKVNELKQEGNQYSIFGDIFLEDLKKYREEQLARLNIECVFPIWKNDTKELIHEFIDSGFKTVVVCVNEKFLDKSFCGRLIDHSFINDLPENVDPCGENGEFHTFTFEGPIFKHPVSFKKGDIVYREYKAPKDENDNCFANEETQQKSYGFYFCDLI